ncbi:MAG: endonuclease/exonuclease/phosphatase family protein [Deltaproteobacteria bacterium]|nr:endonuclease/exonuclease/phosphatase family protein [Deltaproteobacteria bacterium]
MVTRAAIAIWSVAVAACGDGGGQEPIDAAPDDAAVDDARPGAQDAARTSALKVLTWNTGGPLDATAIDLVAAQSPQVVFLQEVDGPDLVENLRVRLQAVQGGTWVKHEISRATDTTQSYVAIVSKLALGNIQPVILRMPGTYVVSCYSSSPVLHAGRAALGATVTIGNKSVAVISVRTSSASDAGCLREQENTVLKNWASTTFPAPHIFGGDFNMQPEAAETEYQIMLNSPNPTTDSWALAVNRGTAISFDGAPSITTPTRNTRLDYIFFDQGAADLDVVSSEILDEGALSDHRMMITTFDVR